MYDDPQPGMTTAMKKITTILFDLGSTLISTHAPWQPIYKAADQAMLSSLREAGIRLDKQDLFMEFGSFLEMYYSARVSSTIERTTSVALREFLAGKGHVNVDEKTIRLALETLYAVTQQNWQRVEDAIPTLELLGRKGYRLGMISNTSDDRNVQQLIDQHGLRSYFEIILTSAGCGIRKPDGRIFQLALEHFKITPEEAAMVGDTLDADILGANRMGIYSIWITPRGEAGEEGELSIQPQAVVSTLAQIPALLEDLNSEVGSREQE